MVAVRRPGNGSEVVPNIFSGEEARAVGEDDVVLGETFFGGGRRVYD